LFSQGRGDEDEKIKQDTSPQKKEIADKDRNIIETHG
jgi:hypothetical protein